MNMRCAEIPRLVALAWCFALLATPKGALAADLRALGAENVTAFGRMVSGRLPITAVPALQGLSSLQFARPAYATTNVEDVGG